MNRLNFFSSTQQRGNFFEEQALQYLLQQGLEFVARNFSINRGQAGSNGEIDLIMIEQKTLVFVEVRQRSSHQFGGAAATITKAKQTRLSRTAQQYLQRYRYPPPCRFDVIAFDAAPMQMPAQKIEWIKNAF